MSNIVKRDPFELDEMFDNLMKGFYIRPMRLMAEMPEAQTIKMDLKETDREYTVHAEIPGVNKEDIHVTVNGNNVAISAEVRKTSEEREGEKLLRSERYYGKVYRSFSLGQEVDEAAAKARFDSGVLELVLPKKQAVASKKLTVE